MCISMGCWGQVIRDDRCTSETNMLLSVADSGKFQIEELDIFLLFEWFLCFE